MTVDVGVPASVVGGDVAGAPTTPSWTVHGDIQQIAGPWVTALGELEEIRRSRTANAGTYSYSYAELGDVLSHARGVLKAHDLAVFQVAEVVNGDVAVSTTVMHTSGAHLTFAAFHLPAGNTAQNVGSSCTYARRYSLMSILGLGTDDDDGATAGTRVSPVPGTLMAQSLLDKFRDAALDVGLDAVDIAAVVLAATDGRTDDVEQVWGSEAKALGEALRAYRPPQVGDADDHARPVSSESGEGKVSSSADPSPDRPAIEDTPDE